MCSRQILAQSVSPPVDHPHVGNRGRCRRRLEVSGAWLRGRPSKVESTSALRGFLASLSGASGSLPVSIQPACVSRPPSTNDNVGEKSMMRPSRCLAMIVATLAALASSAGVQAQDKLKVAIGQINNWENQVP